VSVLEAAPQDAIKARTLNLTLGSGFAAFLVSAVTVFNSTFRDIFGDKLSPEEVVQTKTTILSFVIVAFAAIAVTDLIVRAWTTSASERAAALAVVPAPSNLKAKRLEGADEPGFTVAALRFASSEPSTPEYLLTKAHATPVWVKQKDVQLTAA
jgi:hypothetical protein